MMAWAAAGCAALAMTGGAEAAKRDRNAVVINGCVTMSAPVCRTVVYRKQTYVLNSYIGYIPLNTGVTITGRRADSSNVCSGVWVSDIAYKPNPRVVCK